MHNKINYLLFQFLYNRNTTQGYSCRLDIQHYFCFYAIKHLHNLLFHRNHVYNTSPKHHNYQKLFWPQPIIHKSYHNRKLSLSYPNRPTICTKKISKNVKSSSLLAQFKNHRFHPINELKYTGCYVLNTIVNI